MKHIWWSCVSGVVKSKLELVQASEESLMTARQSQTDKREAERRECELRLKKLKLSQSNTLEQYLDGKLTKDAFQSQKAKTTMAIQEAADRLAELDTQTENASELVESHKPYFGHEALTREMVQGLIKEIRVASADEIEIRWKFGDCYNDLPHEFMP